MSGGDPEERGSSPRATALALWGEVERYITAHVIPSDPDSEAVLEGNERAGLGLGPVSAIEGRLLEVLARTRGARTILEIGTHGGYSTSWLARALAPGGRLVTLELSTHHADVARSNLEQIGLEEVVEVRVGPAIATLSELREEGAGPFDLIFIDADKQSYPAYLDLSLALSAPGTLIVADNVVRAGAILDPDALDTRLGEGGIQALRGFYERLAQAPNLTATVIQTVGGKGHDGFLLAVVGE
jgi:predicted O-methyltransferase YrrM